MKRTDNDGRRRALRHHCPTCGAFPGERCIVEGTGSLVSGAPRHYGPQVFHKARIEATRKRTSR